MSGYNAKNYTEQGGSVTHIGGRLVIEEGAEVVGLPSGGEYTLPAATASLGPAPPTVRRARFSSPPSS